MSIQIDLGPAVAIPKGDWDAETTYEWLNIVRHDSAAWICRVAQSTGVEPSNESNDWFLQAKDISAVSSVNGKRGDVIIDTIDTPATDDNSARIANTEWVTQKSASTLASAIAYSDSSLATATTDIRNLAALDTKISLETAINEMTSTNDTRFATKAELNDTKTYVDTTLANLIDSAPETLNTLGELATALQTNDTLTNTLNSAIGTKANDSEVVKLTGDQTIEGEKTFSATIKGSISGNASFATKAQQDAEGNVITATYATKTETTDSINAVSAVANAAFPAAKITYGTSDKTPNSSALTTGHFYFMYE